MSKKKTIVKNLNAIQNFGAMDILCTDKTGTLTCDKIRVGEDISTQMGVMITVNVFFVMRTSTAIFRLV